MIAGAGFLEILLCQGLAGELIGGGAVALLPVLGGQSADAVDDVDQNGGAESTQALAGDAVVGEDLQRALVGFLQRIHVGNDVELLAGGLDDDGLELLAAHDGAGAGTAGGAVLVVHDGGQQHLLLTSGADVQDGAVGTVLFRRALRSKRRGTLSRRGFRSCRLQCSDSTSREPGLRRSAHPSRRISAWHPRCRRSLRRRSCRSAGTWSRPCSGRRRGNWSRSWGR